MEVVIWGRWVDASEDNRAYAQEEGKTVPLKGALIEMKVVGRVEGEPYREPEPTVYRSSTTTDNAGCYQFTFDAPPQGHYRAVWSVSKDGFQSSVEEGSAGFSGGGETLPYSAGLRPEEGTPIWITLSLAAGILGVVAGIATAIARRNKPPYEAPSEANTSPVANPGQMSTPSAQGYSQPQILVQKSSAGKIAFWVVLTAFLVLAVWYWLYLQTSCFSASQLGRGEDWEIWKYRCP